MALQKQTIPISFGKGIDTKTDSKQVIPGKMIALQNAVFQTTNSFRKRNGYGVIPGSLTTGNAIASYNNELVAMDGQNVYSYSAKQSTMTQKGAKAAVSLSTQSVVRNTNQQTNPDSAVHPSGFSVFAWQDSAGGIRYSVFDSVTSQSIVSNSIVTATGTKPKVLVIGTYVVILYIENPAGTPVLTYKSILNTTPTVLSSATNLLTMTASLLAYDAEVISTRLFVVAQDTSNTLQAFYLDSGLVQSSLTAETHTGLNVLNVFGDSANNVWIAGSTTSGGNTTVFVQVLNFNLSSVVLGTTTVEILAGSNVVANITGISPVTTASVFYEVKNSDGKSYNEYIRLNTVTLAGSVGSAADYLRSVGLASKAFKDNHGTVYVSIVHDSTEQPTYFVSDSSKNIVAKIAPGNGGGLITTNLLPEVNSPSTAIYQFPYLLKDLLSSNQGTVYSQTGISNAMLTFDNTPSVPVRLETLNLANNLHISGGVLSVYDGSSVVEQNFHLYPENISTQFNYTGGGLGIGSYQYSAIYEWTDNEGQIQRSAPSTPITIDNTSGSLFFSGNVNIAPDTISNIDTSTDVWGDLTPGMLVANSNLVSGTTITGKQFSTSLVTVSPTPSGSATNQLITVTPNLQLTISTSAGSKIVNISNQQVTYATMMTTTQGSTTATAYSPAGLRPGMVPASLNPSYVSGYIVSVNGETVTMSGGAVFASQDFVLQQFQMFIKGDFVAGNSTVNNVTIYSGGSLPITLAQGLFNGQEIFNTAAFAPVVAGTTLTITGLNTITLSTPAAATITNAIVNVGTYVAYNLRVGQVLSTNSGLGVPSGSHITALNVPNVTIDAAATSTQSNIAGFVSEVGITKLAVPTLRLTAKVPPVGSNVSVVVYRTIANGEVFYRITPQNPLLLNDVTKDYLVVVDQTPDSLIVGNEILYTTGGEVDNNAVPATNLLTSYKNRAIAISAEDPLSWYFSKQVIAGTPIEFSSFFSKRVSELDGPITAPAQLDDKLIFFKKNSIYYVAGDGPAPNGTNDDFTEAQLITSDTGCINAKSLVTIPNGIMYQSTKGIYLLERSLQVTYIGAEVEAYNTQTITSAKLVEGVNQVRFTLASGVILVYDYYFSQWSVFANLTAADATIFQDLYTFINPNGTVYQETIGSFNDNGAFIPLGLTMSWLSFAGLQGYERAYKVLLLGDYESPHTLTATINYDFATLNTQTISIPVTSPPTGPYQYRLFLQQQKCETFQVSLLESQAGPTYGEGLRLSAISVEVGIKKGLRKMPAAVSYG